MGARNKAAGKALSERRQRLGLTQAEVVAALQSRGIDISLSTYQRIEYGESLKFFLDKNFLEAMADTLKLTPRGLFVLMTLVDEPVVLLDDAMQRLVAFYNRSNSKRKQTIVESILALLEAEDGEQQQ